MIRMREATTLAVTKLRTRKIRLFVTIFISCLLFSGLAAASFVFRGVFQGVDNFSQEGFSDRYLISASSIISDDYEIRTNKDLIAKAEQQNKDLIARKKAEAKRLGVQYDSSTDPAPSHEMDGPNGKQKELMPEHPISQQIIKDYKKAHPPAGLADLKKMTEGYDANDFYESQKMNTGGTPNFTLKVLKEGKEDFAQQMQKTGPNGPPIGTDSFASEWQLMSGELLKPFMLKDATTEVSKDGTIPVIAPYSAAEQLLGLKSLPESATAKEKLARLEEVRSKASSINFSVCYRNRTSASAVDQAVQMQQEIEQNKTNKQFQKPNLIYDVPAEACGAPRVVQDKRTADEKKQFDKETEFKRLFGEAPPEAKVIKFRVIGLASDPPNLASFGLTDIFSAILTSNVGTGWFTPNEIRSKDPTLASIFPADAAMQGGEATFYTQFATAEQAKRFIDDKNCQPNFGLVQTGENTPTNPFEHCAEQGSPFTLAPFGSSSVALIEIKKTFAKIFRTVAIVIAIIAAIIMMGTLGRIVADSRRETAVFRAIGAKQLDIAQIYLTYILLLSLLIAGLAVVIGFAVASIADSRYSDGFTVAALLAYNAQDLSREIHLYAFELRDMLYLVGFTILAGLASAVIPLLSNIRRNPIHDMRDEN